MNLLRPLSRRRMLQSSAAGFGSVALSGLLGQETQGGLLAAREPQFPAKAKRIIFLFMHGGPSQVDTFAPQPRLNREDGRPFSMSVDKTTLQFDNMGKTLIVIASEFGRTPFAQGRDGRDHNRLGFSVGLAGGGLRSNRRVWLQSGRGQG